MDASIMTTYKQQTISFVFSGVSICLTFKGSAIHKHLSAVMYTVIQQVMFANIACGPPLVRYSTSAATNGQLSGLSNGFKHTLVQPRVTRLQKSETARPSRLILIVLVRSCLQKTIMLTMLVEMPNRHTVPVITTRFTTMKTMRTSSETRFQLSG